MIETSHQLTSRPCIGETAVLKRLLEIYAGLPAEDLTDMPLDLSLRMGGQHALNTQTLVYRWLYVGIRQQAADNHTSGQYLREVFEAFYARLRDPSRAGYYNSLVAMVIPHADNIKIGDSMQRKLEVAILDMHGLKLPITGGTQLWRLRTTVLCLPAFEYLLQFGSVASVATANHVRAYRNFTIDLGPLLDDLAWLTDQLRALAHFRDLTEELADSYVLRHWFEEDPLVQFGL